MIDAALLLVGSVIAIALLKAGAERLFNHVDVREPDDPTAPDPTAPGNSKRR